MNEKSYWLGFSSFSGIGPAKFKKLLLEFNSAEKAWNADFESLCKALGPALTPKFIEFRDNFSIPDYEAKLKKQKVGYLCLIDKDYPKLLSQIQKPPFVLYYKGNNDLFYSSSDPEPVEGESRSKSSRQARTIYKTIAIVGTRKITEYGKQVTTSLTQDLVLSGFCIVSGLAFGVDAAAHKTTIENKGKTIAVLGCGVDCCYPRENQTIYNQILESGGAIVSEYPPGEVPSKGSFPSRNRIISGLSQGVLVTEGSADSGALYTAANAFENNRPVFAVPGPITSSLSKGPHRLISKGARLISGAEEILSELRIKNQELGIENEGVNSGTVKVLPKGATKEEQKIIDLLQNEAIHFDQIVKQTKINSSKLGGILSMMEMKGWVKTLDAGFFISA